MLMKHTGSTPIRVKAAILERPPKGEKYVTIEPGEEVECQEGYCHPRVAANGSRVPSVIETSAPGLVPADEEYRNGEWAEAPDKNWESPAPRFNAAQLRSMGVSPGVSEIMEKKAQAELKEKLAAQPSQAPAERTFNTPPAPEDAPAPLPDAPEPKPKKKRGRSKE